jgi:outer membrane protein assembly factor BamB
MKNATHTIKRLVVGTILALSVTTTIHAQPLPSDLVPIDAAVVPHFGQNYYSLQNPWPPLPFNWLSQYNVQLYASPSAGTNAIFVGDLGIDYAQRAAQAQSDGPPVPGGGGGNSGSGGTPQPMGNPQPSYPTNVTLKWQLAVDYLTFQPLALSPDASTLYAVRLNFLAIDLAAVDPLNPNYPDAYAFTLWTTNSWYFEQPAVATDGTIYGSIGYDGNSDRYTFAALSPADGSVLWTFEDPQPYQMWGFSGAPAIGSDGTLYIANQTNVYALTTNGTMKWFYAFPTNNLSLGFAAFNYSSPVVGADGTVYVNSDGGALFALHPANGSLKWYRPPPSDLGYSLWPSGSPAIGPDGTIYFGHGNYFFAVNPANGTYRWTINYGPNWDAFDWSPAVGGDGTIYVETLNPEGTALLAINPTNGTPKWTNQLSDDWLNQTQCECAKRGSIAIAADGEIYLADWDGTLYSFAPDGTTNWTYQTDPSGQGGLNAPLIGPDGTIYVESYEGAPYIYAFAGASPVACSSWPEHRKNARRSGTVVSPASSGHLSFPQMKTNGFQFTINAPTNSVECICASRDLATWTNLGQIVLTNGPANFLDTGASNYQYRFYRPLPQ